MPRAVLLLALLGAAQAADSLEVFGLRWKAPVVSDWKVEGGELHLVVPRPSTQPRRPTQYVLADTPDYLKVTLEAEVQREPAALRIRRNSLILVYAWRDPDHFNYVHLSQDSARQAAVHNGVFHVYGGDRVRISPEEGPGTLLEERWYKVRLEYDGGAGTVQVWVDGQTSPSLRAFDLSLGAGKVGIGSFFDMGKFRNVRISGRRP